MLLRKIDLPIRGGGIAAVPALAADFATRAGQHDRDASFAFENIAALHRAGLLNLSVPEAFGGLGGGLAEVIQVVGGIAQGDPSTALVLSMHYLQMAGVLRGDRWPAALKARLARESLEGVALINALRVEPELGTPARGGLPATTAHRVAGGWRITGRKIYSTGSPALRHGLVWARTDEDSPRVGFFVVRMDSEGLRREKTWDHLGLRASGSDDVLLDDVFVPDELVGDIRAPDQWAARDPVHGIWGSVTIASIYDGIARAARDWLVGYLQSRVPGNLGASLATLPRFQQAVGEIEALLYSNQVLLRDIAARADADLAGVTVEAAGLTKHLVTNQAITAIGRALELTGNPGLSRANPLERHHRDALCGRVHTPQDDMALSAAGRAAFTSGV